MFKIYYHRQAKWLTLYIQCLKSICHIFIFIDMEIVKNEHKVMFIHVCVLNMYITVLVARVTGCIYDILIFNNG